MYRLHVPCERLRGYDAIIPCPKELMDNLAEDYAVSKNWCDFNHPAAIIPTLSVHNVDRGASAAFQKPRISVDFPVSITSAGAATFGTTAGNGSSSSGTSGRVIGTGFSSGSTVGSNKVAQIDPQGVVGSTATANIPRNRNVRLAFFFTIYADATFVTRLLNRLYSPTHYYLLHLDASMGGVSIEFEAEMRALANKYPNVFLAKDTPIVYGASTATILLTRAMAWFDKYATGWDYFVPLTGSDDPLVPLSRIEHIFAHQNPPLPFVMAWTPGNFYFS